MQVTSSFPGSSFTYKAQVFLVAKCVVFALLCVSFCFQGVADAQSYASSERSAAALGHYARARAMLIEALAEFEEGKRLANPDLLIDSEQWRLTVVSRAEELNRVLDPKPKVTRSGVRYKAHKRFIRHDPFYRHRNIGPKMSNTDWESQFKSEKKEPVQGQLTKDSASERKSVTKKSSVTRKDSKSFHTEQANVVSAARSKVEPIVEPPSEELGYQDAKIVDSMADNSVVEQEVDSVSPSEKSAEEVEEEIDTIVQNFGSDGVEEDPELLQAIQDVVQSRLDDMDGGPASAD